MVEIFDDRVEIYNPGGIPISLKPEQFGKRSGPRNPNIESLLHRAGYIEKMGTGILRIQNTLADFGNPPAEFTLTDFFTVNFQRIDTDELSGKSSGKIIELIRENQFVTQTEIAEQLGIGVRAVRKQMAMLKEVGLLKRIGPDKGGHWKIKD